MSAVPSEETALTAEAKRGGDKAAAAAGAMVATVAVVVANTAAHAVAAVENVVGVSVANAVANVVLEIVQAHVAQVEVTSGLVVVVVVEGPRGTPGHAPSYQERGAALAQVLGAVTMVVVFAVVVAGVAAAAVVDVTAVMATKESVAEPNWVVALPQHPLTLTAAAAGQGLRAFY